MWQKATLMLRSQENKTMLLPAELDYKALTVSRLMPSSST
jgi:hypothetical protein